MVQDVLKTAVSVAVLLKLVVLLEGGVLWSLNGLPMMVARRHTPLYRLVVVLLAEVVMFVVVVVMSVVVEVTVVAVVWTAVLVTGVTVVVVCLAADRWSDYHYWIHCLLHQCLYYL